MVGEAGFDPTTFGSQGVPIFLFSGHRNLPYGSLSSPACMMIVNFPPLLGSFVTSETGMSSMGGTIPASCIFQYGLLLAVVAQYLQCKM